MYFISEYKVTEKENDVVDDNFNNKTGNNIYKKVPSEEIEYDEKFINWLNKGKEDTIVYHGVNRYSEKVYTGITKHVLGVSFEQHTRGGKKIKRLEPVSNNMTRNQARAFEEMFINNNTYNNDKNFLATEYKQRYNSLRWGVRRKLKKSEDCDYQLKFIESESREINEGDIFLIMPEEGIYFYGKVLEAKIENKYNSFIENQYLVCIFKCKTRNISMENFKPDYNNLLIQPAVVTKGYWTQGLFYTIGNIPLTEEEKNLDYGLYNSIDGKFYKANGTLIERKPKIYGGYGITTGIGIAIEVEEELIIDPSLLEFK